jgi:hypothetical protein
LTTARFWAKAGAAIKAKTAVAALSICFFMDSFLNDGSSGMK